MPPPSHNFRSYFTLVKNPNNPSNATAVCNWCIRKYGGLGTAQLKPECCTVNRARLCRNHLSKCEAFREANSEEEVHKILALPVPEDKKKTKKRKKNEETDGEGSDNESANLYADSIISNTSSQSSNKSRQSAIPNFFGRPLSASEQSRFEQLLLRMIVSNALSFTFVENEDTIAVFEFLVPGLKLPKRKLIGGKVLMKSAKLLQDNITKIAKSDTDGVTATFDGWTNVKREHIWGVIFITTNGQSLIWGAHDISSERSQTQNVINHIEQLITETEEKRINIKAFVSDSAGEYAAARRQLRRKYPSKVFLPCMAHQTNLIFGEIFKESHKYQRISKEAIKIVSFFHKSLFFMGNLRDEQMRIYKKFIALIMPGDTRWNSYYFCFHSISKSKSALKFLSSKFNDHRSNVIRTNSILSEPANNQTTLRNGTRKLPDDIADIINDTQFWIILADLQELLYPLCGFLNKLQKDTAQLYEVLHCFGYMMKLFECHEDFEFGARMKARIETRWNEWEQPLMILSFALHPEYKLTKFNSMVANLSWTHIGQWLKYYYEAWFNCKPVSILAELIKFKRGIDPYDIESFQQFNGNLVDFWESTEGVGPELARAAIRVHGICVNSASVERLWSSMGLLHTNRRVRLQQNKALAMSQIRSDILWSRKIKNTKEYDDQVRRLHIAAPIRSDDEIDEQESVIVDLDYQVSDDDGDAEEETTTRSFNWASQNFDENEDSITEEEQRWENIINEWIEFGDRENQFENKDDEILLSSEWDTDFSLGGREKHPADDEMAKWPLDSLLISSLEMPLYFNSEYNS